jgi:hypothetical protein
MSIEELGYISIPASNCPMFNVAISKLQTVGYFNFSKNNFMYRRFQKNIVEERKTVSKRLPSATVTLNIDFDEELETPKLNLDWTK